MQTSNSINSEIIKRTFRVSLIISVFLFLITSLGLFSLQINQKHRSIGQKIEIDSEFIVNAIKIGDLFFITKYLAAFASSGAVHSCGLLAEGQNDWIGISPSPEYGENLLQEGIFFSPLATTVRGSMKIHDQSQASWNFYYSYRINHLFYLYAAFSSLFLSIIIFVFLKKILKDTASFFSEPVENLYKDLDEQIANPMGDFQVKNYSQGRHFQETDRFITEISRLLTTVNSQNEKIKKAEVQDALVRLGRQVNHDIQSPLGALQAAVERIDVNREAATLLIKKSAARIQSIVSDLKIGKLELNSFELMREKTDFNEFVENLIQEKRAEYGPTIEINFHPGEENIDLEIDRSRLARAISNIINNGVEAVTSRMPVIHVNIAGDSEVVELIIEDNGPGIPEELKRKVFEYGFTSGKDDGMGTGLTQAAEVFEMHGGSISLRPSSSQELNAVILKLRRGK